MRGRVDRAVPIGMQVSFKVSTRRWWRSLPNTIQVVLGVL
jgi:hypothetical protein